MAYDTTPGGWMNAVLLAGLTGLLAFKPPVRVSATTNITLVGLQTIDGVTLLEGDAVLLAGQTAGTENGAWTASAGGWTRRADGLLLGSMLLVRAGSVRGQTIWCCTNAAEPRVGADAITFAEVSGGGGGGSDYFVDNPTGGGGSTPSADIELPGSVLAMRAGFTGGDGTYGFGPNQHVTLNVHDDGTSGNDAVALEHSGANILRWGPNGTSNPSVQLGVSGWFEIDQTAQTTTIAHGATPVLVAAETGVSINPRLVGTWTTTTLAPGVGVVDFSGRNWQQFIITGTTTFTATNLPGGIAGLFYLAIEQDGTGGRAYSFSGTDFRWEGGTVPPQSTSAGATDVYECILDPLASRVRVMRQYRGDGPVLIANAGGPGNPVAASGDIRLGGAVVGAQVMFRSADNTTDFNGISNDGADAYSVGDTRNVETDLLGGNVTITTGLSGEFALTAGGATRLTANATGLGLYTNTPVAQAADVGALTDSTTGTPSTTIGDVGVVFNQATLNNIHASFLAKINALRLVLHNLGATG